jgi:AhpD family alkylhydroperoxidase
MKEMVYLAVSVTNSCEYGIACHTALARKAGMTDQMFTELMAVVGMANQTNRFADGFRLQMMRPSTGSPSRMTERAPPNPSFQLTRYGWLRQPSRAGELKR